jgi:hypothetical protein
LREARQTLNAATSFNIVANGATELSWCDFSAEVELQRREEGEMTGPRPAGVLHRTPDKGPTRRGMVYRQVKLNRVQGIGKMKIVALFLLCLFSETAIAQTSECQSIPKAGARLACYDKMSPPIAPGKSATPKTQPASEPGQFVDPLSAENARTDAAVKNICRGC